MMPGMNPRMMKQAMKRMGITQEDIDATQVIIRCVDKDIIISNPTVAKVNMGGQVTFQINGEAHEQAHDITPEIGEDDIKTVRDQAGVTEEAAIAALEKSGGDLAGAIMDLTANTE